MAKSHITNEQRAAIRHDTRKQADIARAYDISQAYVSALQRGHVVKIRVTLNELSDIIDSVHFRIERDTSLDPAAQARLRLLYDGLVQIEEKPA